MHNAISKFSANVRLFYRKTMNEFKSEIHEFDIIINGIKVNKHNEHIISSDELNCWIIGATADAGNSIEGTRYTNMNEPLYKENDVYFNIVNNSPSIFFRNASENISKVFTKYLYKPDIKKYYKLVKEI